MSEIKLNQQGASRFWSRRYIYFGLLVILTVQIINVLLLMPKVSDWWSDVPIIYGDHDSQFYYSVVGGQAFKEHLRTWAYDPFLMAGSPNDLVDCSARPSKVLLGLTGLIHPVRVYKLFCLVFAALPPLLMFLAALNFGMDRVRGLLAALLTVLAWWYVEAHSLLEFGNVSMSLINFYAVYLISLVHRYLEHRELRCALLLLPVACLGPLLHVILPVLVIVPILLMILTRVGLKDLRAWAYLLTVGLCVILSNLFWLIPSWKFGDILLPAPWSIFPMSMIRLGINNIPIYGAPVSLLLLVMGYYGVYRWWKEGHKNKTLALGGGALFVLFLFLFGGFIPVVSTRMEPAGRFAISCFVFLLLPMTEIMMRCLKAIKDSRQSLRHRVLALLPVLLLLPSIFFVAVPLEVRKLSKWNSAPEGNLFLSENSLLLAEAIEKYTRPGARIMIEGLQGAAEFIMPYLLQREYLSGPFYGWWIKHEFAGFYTGKAFHNDLSQHTAVDIMPYLELYNVGYVVCASEIALEFFDSYPEHFRLMGSASWFKFYEVKQDYSFFIEGQGRVVADYDRLTLSRVHTQTGRIVLSYHWLDSFKTDPPAKIYRVDYLDDPIGFIAVDNPPESLVIYNSD